MTFIHAIVWILLNSTQLKTVFNSTPLSCNPPVWHIVGALQVDSMVNWPMRCDCLQRFAENLHEFSLYSRDMSSIVCRPPHCCCAGSICKRSFSIRTRYGDGWRNIQEPGFKTVRHNRAKPRCTVLPSCLGKPARFTQVYPWELLSDRCRCCSLLARPAPGAYLTHHQWCLPWSLPAAMHNLPLLGRMSRRPAHWQVDHER